MLKRALKAFLSEMGELTVLFWEVHRWMFRPPFEMRLFLRQAARVGVESLGTVMLGSFFIGMVLALQTGYTLEVKMKGVTQFVGGVVALSMVRELGPVLTAFIVTGRVGSAVAAEIASMKVTEQLDALTTLAAHPVHYLAVPRFLAFTFMFPCLTVLADVTGWLGGLLVAKARLSSTTTLYWDSTLLSVEAGDFLGGLFKALFFGAAVAVVCCRRGFAAERGAEGVGKATTQAVVISFVTILISDYFLTALLTALGV